MRGLLKASLLLAPALATAFVVPEVAEDFEDVKVDRVVADHSFSSIGVRIPTQSPDEWSPEDLTFRLDVHPSKEPCGIGSVTVDGQFLPQTVHGDVASGKGSITTDRRSIVVASWSFHCIKVNGQLDSQFLKFVVDFVDGKAMEDVGFSALFRQTGSTEIINIETDLSIPAQVAANPNPESLQPIGYEDEVFPQLSIEQEVDELDWLRAQLKELEHLIWVKESAIAQHSSVHFEEEVRDCDSLKCLAKAVVDKARKAAHKVFDEIHGEHHPQDFEEEEFGRFPKLEKPDWQKKPKHGKPGNHTCGPPKHGNHTAPPWKKPHHKPLPICRYPPPPRMGGPRHRIPHYKPHHPPPPPPPPHHGPPKHGDGPPPPPPHGPHREFPEDGEMPSPPPGHHGDFPHDGPPKDHDGKPGREDMGPPHDGPHHGPGHEAPEFDHPPPPPHHPGSESEAPFHAFDDEFQPHHLPPPPPPFDGPPLHAHGLGKAFHIIKFVVVGILISLLVIALHQRTCNPKNRADRQARREERRRRRAFCRAAHKHAITQFLDRISGNASDDESDDYEEKRQALLASAAEDGMSTTMTKEITQFRNAAKVVDDIVSAQSQVQPIPITSPASEGRSLMGDFDIGSQVGDGEELPAYEDNDGSEMSSVVADGFRYTPGSTEYSPSPAGSVSDILGPDTKQ